MNLSDNPMHISNTSESKLNKKMLLVIGGILGLISLLVVLGLLLRNRMPQNTLNPFNFSGSSLVPEVKKVPSPLTGQLFAEIESEEWINSRPLGVMINNHVDARPQWGIGQADIVYEIVAEGGITRYLAFFQSELPEKVGPIRSTREYYLVLVKELMDAMIMHIGWSPQALEAIETWPVRSLGRGAASFERDQSRLSKGVAIEHTAYADAHDLKAKGIELGWAGLGEFRPWLFKDSLLTDPNLPIAQKIAIDFWFEGDYSAIFTYDPETNTYIKHTGYDSTGMPIVTIDANTNKPVKISNLIVQFSQESSITGDEKHRLEYELTGSGSGLVFIDGKVIKVTWTKASRDARTVFYDTSGKEMEFNRGKFWISIVPDRNQNQVVY